jgi:hypothetical protein
MQVRKNTRIQQSMKLASTSNNEDDSNADLNGQSSSGCSSEDDSINASQKLNGKTKSRRGSATGPQSIYARVSPYKCLQTGPTLSRVCCL